MQSIQAPRPRFHARRFALVAAVTLAALAAVGLTLRPTPASARVITRFPPRTTTALSDTLPVTAGRISSAQCQSCHAPEPVLSHPTNLSPTMRLPVGFPLENGTLNCTTCHLDTATEHTSTTTSTNPFLLRGTADPTTFCIQCHADTAPNRHAQHPLALSRAHLSWKNARSSTVQSPLSPYEDGFRACLSCHDGTMASDAFMGALTASTGGSSMGVSGSNHPVGMAYPLAPRLGDRALLPAAMLDHRIQLTNGQVACTSCHSLYSPEQKLLVMPNRDSALCTSCHTMQ